MADRSAAGGDDFVTVRDLRPGSIVTIGHTRVEIVEGRPRVRIVAADGQHVRIGFQKPGEATGQHTDPATT